VPTGAGGAGFPGAGVGGGDGTVVTVGAGGGAEWWRARSHTMAPRTTTVTMAAAMRPVGGWRDRPSVGISDMSGVY
jgi:hypothetical protein